MHKLLVLYSMPTDVEHFRNYYVETHLPLVRKVSGIKGLRYSMDVNRFGGESPYFCVAEIEFEDRNSMKDALRSEEGRAMSADTENFASEGSVVLHYTTAE